MSFGDVVAKRGGAVVPEADDVRPAASVVVELTHRIREAEPGVRAGVRIDDRADDVAHLVHCHGKIANERRRAEDRLELEQVVHGDRSVQEVLARVLSRAGVADKGGNGGFGPHHRPWKRWFLGYSKTCPCPN